MTRWADEGFVGRRWGSRGAGLLFTTGDKILLTLRSADVEEPHTWGIPGGAVRRDAAGRFDDDFAAALLEAEEELGPLHEIMVPWEKLGKVAYEEDRFAYTTFLLRVPASATRVRFQLNWENDDARWFTRAELAGLDLHFGVRFVLDEAADVLFAAGSSARRGTRAIDLDAIMAKVAATRAKTPRGRQVPLLDLDALIAQTRAVAAASRGSGPPILYFASGSQHPGQVRGFAEIGHPLGVSAPECSANCERELLALAGTGLPLFIDSGAVEEVKFDKRTGEARTVKPIADTQWRKRLALYLRLAKGLGAQLWVVVPDKLFDQDETLARWARYRREVQQVRAAGANLLVPLQHGHRSLVQMHAEADRIFGAGSWTPAIPAREGATPLPAIRAYAAAVKPPRVHLLGISMAARKQRAPEMIDALRASRPDMAISMDSALVVQHSGKDKPGGRRLTRSEAEAQEELDEYRWGDPPDEARTIEGWRLMDYTTWIYFPSGWLDPEDLDALAAEVGLTGKDRAAFLADPDEWVGSMWDEDAEPGGWVPALMDDALDKAWVAFRRKQEVAERKRRGVVKAFGKG